VGGYKGQVREQGSSSRATWERGGRFLSQLGGFQVSRRGYKGGEKGNWQGEVKARGMRHV
jgi:hypothetical protein